MLYYSENSLTYLDSRLKPWEQQAGRGLLSLTEQALSSLLRVRAALQPWTFQRQTTSSPELLLNPANAPCQAAAGSPRCCGWIGSASMTSFTRYALVDSRNCDHSAGACHTSQELPVVRPYRCLFRLFFDAWRPSTQGSGRPNRVQFFGNKGLSLLTDACLGNSLLHTRRIQRRSSTALVSPSETSFSQ